MESPPTESSQEASEVLTVIVRRAKIPHCSKIREKSARPLERSTCLGKTGAVHLLEVRYDLDRPVAICRYDIRAARSASLAVADARQRSAWRSRSKQTCKCADAKTARQRIFRLKRK